MPKSKLPRGLMTEQQVLDALQKEIKETSLTGVAKKYGLHASQLSDVLNGRAGLSKRMASFLGLVIRKYYEKAGQ